VDKGVWRIRYNNELCKLMGGEDITSLIKAQRIQWLGHVKRMDETAMSKSAERKTVRNEKNRKT